jgi:hypothetical protein
MQEKEDPQKIIISSMQIQVKLVQQFLYIIEHFLK